MFTRIVSRSILTLSAFDAYSFDLPMVSGSVGRRLRQGMSGWTFPVGLCALLVNHRGISQPRHLVLTACLPLMGPFRGMLLTADKWLLLLSLKGSPGTCMPGVC